MNELTSSKMCEKIPVNSVNSVQANKYVSTYYTKELSFIHKEKTTVEGGSFTWNTALQTSSFNTLYKCTFLRINT